MTEAQFEKAVAALTSITPRPEITLDEMPAPQKLAPFSFAISAEVTNGDYEIGSGRFVLLHQPGGQDAWEGEFRCVSYLSVDLEEMMQDDPLLPEVGWNWLLESLSNNGCNLAAASGTVTRAVSHSFGKLTPNADGADIEIRASWTPVISSPADIASHFEGWLQLLAELAGLAPIPEGVATFAKRR